jgi:hypothetical protein
MPITQVKTITTSTGLLVDHNEIVRFLGVGDRLSFSYLAGNDTAIAEGRNQTMTFARSNGNTIIDEGHGLKLEFGLPTTGDFVIGFQNDPTGTLAFAAPVTFTSDHHGGTIASAFGVSVDFVGFRDAHALEARIRPYT